MTSFRLFLCCASVRVAGSSWSANRGNAARSAMSDGNTSRLATGSLAWSVPIASSGWVPSAVVQGPAIAGGAPSPLVFCGPDSALQALDARTGAPTWHSGSAITCTGGDVCVAVNGTIYGPAYMTSAAGARTVGLFAYTPSAASALWQVILPPGQRANPNAVALSPVLYEPPSGANASVLVVTLNDGTIVGVNAHDGSTLWSAWNGWVYYASLTVSNSAGLVLVLSNDRTRNPGIAAYDVYTGAFRWSQYWPSGLSLAFVAPTGIVYASNLASTALMSLNLKTGAVMNTLGPGVDPVLPLLQPALTHSGTIVLFSVTTLLVFDAQLNLLRQCRPGGSAGSAKTFSAVSSPFGGIVHFLVYDSNSGALTVVTIDSDSCAVLWKFRVPQTGTHSSVQVGETVVGSDATLYLMAANVASRQPVTIYALQSAPIPSPSASPSVQPSPPQSPSVSPSASLSATPSSSPSVIDPGMSLLTNVGIGVGAAAGALLLVAASAVAVYHWSQWRRSRAALQRQQPAGAVPYPQPLSWPQRQLELQPLQDTSDDPR